MEDAKWTSVIMFYSFRGGCDEAIMGSQRAEDVPEKLFVVGLGGGSCLDASKAIAIMATNPGDYWDYIHGGSGKGQPVTEAPLPIVAITTTAGTGTEADPWAVVTNEVRNEKIGFGMESTFPVLSVVDPEMMVSVPPHIYSLPGL